jgi:hypothetical protein
MDGREETMKTAVKWERKLGKLARQSVKPEATTKTSIRVPVPLWDRVRMLAIQRHKTTQELVLEAIKQLVKEGEQL